MPSESVLKVLIALNAVQMFITLLLIATMASASLSSGTTTVTATDYGQLGSAPDPFASSGSPGDLPGDDKRPAEDGFSGDAPDGPEADGAGPEEDGPDGPPPAASGEDPGSSAAASEVETGRTKIIMKTYLNLVSRRLQVAASDAGVDPEPWLPTSDEIAAAVESGDASSDAFTAALEKLRPGYAQLEMDFPSPPASKGASGAN